MNRINNQTYFAQTKGSKSFYIFESNERNGYRNYLYCNSEGKCKFTENDSGFNWSEYEVRETTYEEYSLYRKYRYPGSHIINNNYSIF